MKQKKNISKQQKKKKISLAKNRASLFIIYIERKKNASANSKR